MEHWSEPCSLNPNLFCDHKRAHWFWRRTASGQPGKPPGGEPRPRSRREMVWEGSLGVWVSSRVERHCSTPDGTVLTLLSPLVRLLRSDACPLRLHICERPRRPDLPLVEGPWYCSGLLCLHRDVHLRQLGAFGLDSDCADRVRGGNLLRSAGCAVLSSMSKVPVFRLCMYEANGRARLPRQVPRFAKSRQGLRW